MKTLASAGFTFLVKFIFLLGLGIVLNVILTVVYWDNIMALVSGDKMLLGSITLISIFFFPFIWFFISKKEATLSAIFKIVDKNVEVLIGFIIDKFVREENKDKLGDYMGVLEKQPKIIQIILGFFFEKIDFFGEVSQLLKEKDYSNEELKVKMLEVIKEKELFEEWEPSFMTPLIFIGVNIGIIALATRFL